MTPTGCCQVTGVDRVGSRRHSSSPIRWVLGAVTGLMALAAVVAACGTPDAPPATAPVTATSQEPDATSAATPTSDPIVAATTTVYRPPPLPDPSPPLSSPGDNRVYVLGDSVVLGAQTTLPAALVGWRTTFDAQESRLIDQGLEVLRARKVRYDAEQQAAHEKTMVIADWAPFGPAPGYTYDDGIHLTAEGRTVLADLVARAVGPAPRSVRR